MPAALHLALPLALVLMLAGCSASHESTIGAGAAASLPPAGPAVHASGMAVANGSNAGTDADIGNGRPIVTWDGLRVRRRIVIALRTRDDTDLSSLRAELERTAHSKGLAVTDASSTVLDAAALEELAPTLILSLPAGVTRADARAIVVAAASHANSLPEVEEYRVTPVLMHDLRFQVASADPSATADLIDREGILSDALGSYRSVPGDGELSIDYTGSLLGDTLIGSIRAAIGRAAGADPLSVSVLPRSLAGIGVDMAIEPVPKQAPSERINSGTLVSHGHDLIGIASTDAAAPAQAASATQFWPIYGLGLALLLLLSVVILWKTRAPRVGLQPDPGDDQDQ